jgi:hypothetical protein
MANSSAWTPDKNTGERVTAAEFNALNDGQVAAITRGGTTSLTSDVTLTGYRLLLDDTGSFGYSTTQSFKRVQNCTCKSLTGFAWNGGANMYGQTVTGGALCIPLDNLPDGAILTAVSVIFMGNVPAIGPGFAGLPGTMPGFYVYKTSATAGTITSLGNTTDATAVLATFNAAHTVTKSGLAEAINHGAYHSYNVDIAGAGGANYVNGLGVLSVYCTFDAQTVKP